MDQISVPSLGDAGDAYLHWGQNLVTVTFADGRWALTDFQRTVASQSKDFTPYTWRSSMDRGNDWRRAPVSE